MKQRALQVSRRVAVHRKQRKAAGLRRVELSLLAQDVALLRKVAAVLRQGGPAADALRGRIAVSVDPVRSTGGGGLVEFFRRSPLVGLDLEFVRDRSDR